MEHQRAKHRYNILSKRNPVETRVPLGICLQKLRCPDEAVKSASFRSRIASNNYAACVHLRREYVESALWREQTEVTICGPHKTAHAAIGEPISAGDVTFRVDRHGCRENGVRHVYNGDRAVRGSNKAMRCVVTVHQYASERSAIIYTVGVGAFGITWRMEGCNGAIARTYETCEGFSARNGANGGVGIVDAKPTIYSAFFMNLLVTPDAFRKKA